MTAEVLDRVLTCYRIGDPAGHYPIFDATGSTVYPGRWNTAACPILYTSEHCSTAMLEKLAHGSGHMPIVPSVVAREERNILINPQHPELGQVKNDLAVPVWWDARLFSA